METIEIKSPKSATCQAEPEAEERPSSPNDCAICLEQLSDKSFTNSCFHMFCFHCLLAWSKVKPECPLCKQDFCSIIHNIRSMDDYDEYRVPPAPMRYPTPEASFLSALRHHNNFISGNRVPRGQDFFSANRRFFSYRTTLLSGGFSVPRERSSSLVIQPYVDNLQIQNYPNVSSSQSLALTNRKEVYLKELEIRPIPIGRHRSCSPEFYRENEGQLHRLGRWLNRELLAISQLGMRFSPDAVLSLIMEMLPVYDIQGAVFHSNLFPYLGIHTRRFITEFHNFAVSPYEMEQYDRECVYLRRRAGSQLAFIVTVGGDDSEDVQVIPSPPVNHPVRPWIDFTEFRPRLLNMPIGNRPPTIPVSNAPVINISDSENDDCVILDEVRQTPETIVLEDSDAENPQPGPAPRSPQPSTSGYKPPDKNDDSVIVLPSTSHPEECKFASNEPKFSSLMLEQTKCLSNRSPSINSVISTDNSVILSESSDLNLSKKRKRKCKDKYSKRSAARRKSLNYFCSVTSESSEFESDDSEWEESRKKKKKIKKPDKSDKKYKKHRKSPKRKKCTNISEDSDNRETHKSKHSVKRKSKKREPVEGSTSTSTSNFKNPYPEYDNETVTVSKPKLRSVVKKVQKSTSILEPEKRVDLPDSDGDVIPGSSFGLSRPNCDRKLSSFIMRRTIYSSDSD